MAFTLSVMLADAGSAVGTFLLLSLSRFGAENWAAAWRRAGIEPLLVMCIYAAAWVAVLLLNGLYRSRVRWSTRTEAVDIARSGVLLAILTFSALFIFKMPEVSRLFLIALFPLQVAVTLGLRMTLRLAFRAARERGFSRSFVLVVGTGDAAEAFARRIERHRELGLQVIGHLRWSGSDKPPVVSRSILGTIDDIEDVLHEH